MADFRDVQPKELDAERPLTELPHSKIPFETDAHVTAGPLLDVFRELRRRNFPLGVTEYVTALRALDAGFGMGVPGEHREAIRFLCQALWAKSLEERHQVADVIELVLPRRPTDAEIRRLEDALAEEARRHEPATPGDPPSPPYGPDVPPREPESRQPSPPPAAGEAAAPRGRMRESAAADIDDAVVLPLAVASPVFDSFQLDPHFDLVGTLPVTHRQMSRAWRFYRRMARTGPRTELDADATLDRLARDGVLAEPVFVPRRTNQARALVLVDTGGSMTPFRYVTVELLAAARQAGLSRVDVRWFHDAPRGVVHRDEGLADPVTIGAAAAPFADAGVLIYGDAGAARGGLDARRVDDSRRMIETLRRYTPAIAWLNPVPRARWAGTTAQAIRDRTGIAMLPLDRQGVNAAVDVMRGLVR